MRSEDLFLALSDEVGFDFSQNPFWWPKFGSFLVIVGAILTQNTKWQNVEKALVNLQNANINSLDDIANLDDLRLAELIKPSGFYNTKAKRLNNLAKNIISKFENFEEFQKQVSRKWLIAQKGLGFESVDSILCYACKRDIMVVDSYTLKIFEYLDYSFDSYDEAREWLESIDRDAIYAKFGVISDNEIFAKFHGLIVEFCKTHLKGKVFDDVAVNLLKKLS